MLNDRLNELATRFRRQRAIPVVRQLAITECGAACLAMVLQYYGRHVRLEELRDVVGVTRDGTTAYNLITAARYYGLRGRGVSADIDDLKFLDRGAILNWEFNHFVVFERATSSYVDIVDPESGRRRIPMERFSKSYTGVALLFEPDATFEKATAAPRTFWRNILGLVSRTSSARRTLILSIVLQLLAVAVPVITGVVVDDIVPFADYSALGVLAVLTTTVVVFYFIANLLRSYFLLSLRTYLDGELTTRFLEHLVALPFSFFQRRGAGDLMMRMNSNATIREILTSGVLSVLLDGAMVLLYVVLLLVISPAMGALVIGFGVLQSFAFIVTRHKQRELLALSLQAQANSQNYQYEILAGIETLKAMGQESRAIAQWSDLFCDLLNALIVRGRLTAWVDAFNAAVKTAAPMAVLLSGTYLVLGGRISLGNMFAINALASAFLLPLASVVSTAGQLQLLGTYLSRIEDVMLTTPEQDRSTVRPAPKLKGDIELRDVSFRYSSSGPDVVSDVNLSIPAGSFIAVVGKSGCGKSTLANLILGLNQPTKGEIRFDGEPISRYDLRSVRRQLGVVPQHSYVFATTIRGNIALAEPTMPLDDVIAAAKAAQVHDEISRMPMGYDTLMIDGGSSISGGQRQRIALARALATSPVILLLDEATSALDAGTEGLVQTALSQLNCTRIVIAHRLSSIINADRILVLENGRIVESGSHDALLRLGGAYARLISRQAEGEAQK